MNQNRIMAHMIAGYPSMERSFEVAQALLDGGASFLEVQFPFSDPSADGPTIQKACTQALEAGFRVRQGFDLIRRIREYRSDVPVYIMSYASLVFTKGVEAFCREAREAGVEGLIIPDLAPGSDEGLYEEGRRAGLRVMPVVVPTISPVRLEEIQALDTEYVYIALRVGITGVHTELETDTLDFLGRWGQTKILAGFGIDSPEQVRFLRDRVHGLIVGSALVRQIPANPEESPYDSVKSLISSLVQA